VKKLRNFFRGTYLGLMLIFLYAPILVLMVFSFNGSKSMARWTGFSFKWYEALMHDSTIMNALMVTLSVAVISALVATFIGTFAAIGIHSMKKRPRAVVENISRLPMVNPDLVTGISFMMLFAAMGIKGGYTRMLIAHITFNIPYVIFSVMPKLRQSSNLLYEAAMDLGCTPMMAIRKVVIPDIMPGIVSGFVLAFTLSLDDFVVSWFATDGIQNLSIYIYGIARRGISPKINALCTIMFVVVVALLVFINLKSINEERAAETQRKKLSITR
jgi:spermidine/putrescine transport system permease protein potC